MADRHTPSCKQRCVGPAKPRIISTGYERQPTSWCGCRCHDGHPSPGDLWAQRRARRHPTAQQAGQQLARAILAHDKRYPATEDQLTGGEVHMGAQQWRRLVRLAKAIAGGGQ